MSREKQALTMWDIAAAAGVSVATVSRALSGSAFVTAAKRAAVLAATERFHFRPNVVAQGLARGRSRALGVLVTKIANLFYGPILAGIAEELRESPYQPIFAEARLEEDVSQALDIFLERRVDALILVGGWTANERLAGIAAKLPLVAIERVLPGREDHCLRTDNLEGATAAMRHLLDLGHDRIAHITGLPSHPDAIDRREGYVRALGNAGLPSDPRLIVEGDFEEASGFQAVQTLLERRVRFGAIFAGNDQMAYGALLALFRRGLKVPRDVSLVGFDDQHGAAYTTPPLTTVRQPVVEMGRAATAAVLRMLEGAPLELPKLRTELIVRESTSRHRGPSRRKGPTAIHAAGSKRWQGRGGS